MDTASGRWGYINRVGRFVIQPCFRAALEFSNGVAPVLDTAEVWHKIDKAGRFLD
jgi:hypothetical protein